jgi:Zn-finger nucleic acid-binding protein
LSLYQKLVVSLAMSILDHAETCPDCGGVHLTKDQEDKVLDGLARLVEYEVDDHQIAPVWP